MGLFDAFDGAAANKAEDQQVAGLNAGYAQASGLIGQGNQQLETGYGAALAPFTTNLGATQAGQTQLGNLLGLNGASGNQQAQSTLQSAPGYQFALNQGAQNVDRNAAAGGNLVSGNTLGALQTQGQGQATQNYGSLVSSLEPYLGASTANAAGAAGVNTGLANQLNQNSNNQAGLAYSTQTGIGNAEANGTLGQAASTAGGLQSILSLGGAALGGLGGLGGIGNFLGGFLGSSGSSGAQSGSTLD